jgi:tetratricopeptide (TPR) repeat protein
MMKHAMAAREEIEKALALDPDNSNALLARGVGRLLAPAGYGGDVDAAITDFERVIAKKPSAEAYSYLGEAFKNKGLKDKAAAAFKRALDYSH